MEDAIDKYIEEHSDEIFEEYEQEYPDVVGAYYLREGTHHCDFVADNIDLIYDYVKEKYFTGEGVGFERIRRITGYLVGTLDRFNNAKKAEVQDRVSHGVSDEEYQEAMEGFSEWSDQVQKDNYENGHIDLGEEN